MKTIIYLFAALLLTQAHSQEAATPVSADKDREVFAVKLGIQDYQYEETGFTKLDGNLLNLALQFRSSVPGERATPLWYSADLSYAFGNTDFTGGLQNGAGGTTALSASSRERNLNTELHFGATFFDSARQALDVYAGAGFWKGFSQLRNPRSYTRKAEYLYPALGAQYSYKPAGWISLVAGVQYNHIVIGKSKIQLSEQNAAFEDMNKKFHSGSGLRLSLSGEMHDLLFSPLVEIYHQTWTIDDSLTERHGAFTLTEPSSETTMTGINVGWRFSEI